MTMYFENFWAKKHQEGKLTVRTKQTAWKKRLPTKSYTRLKTVCSACLLVKGFSFGNVLETWEIKSTILYSKYLGKYFIFLSPVFSVEKARFECAVFWATEFYKCLCWLVRAAKPNSNKKPFNCNSVDFLILKQLVYIERIEFAIFWKAFWGPLTISNSHTKWPKRHGVLSFFISLFAGAIWIVFTGALRQIPGNVAHVGTCPEWRRREATEVLSADVTLFGHVWRSLPKIGEACLKLGNHAFPMLSYTIVLGEQILRHTCCTFCSAWELKFHIEISEQHASQIFEKLFLRFLRSEFLERMDYFTGFAGVF
jgi:hypothetical protein